MQTKIGVYPGTFDPITKGHVDLIERALMLVHDLVIAVIEDSSTNKSPIFSHDERVAMVQKDIAHLDNERIKVVSFNGLLIDFAHKHGATRIIRGLRAVSDFEYEMQMAFMNKRLAPDIATVFLPAAEETQFISSKMVKEIARLGGDVSSFVSDNVRHALSIKYNSLMGD
ncbi:MAG: pantetheine-phosphate adenylyltransferase [Alphaproteobacteria bacterium CG11_big_fil_rev_8_21_14_0_20_44_7]|nr:MAG: pantetheine-phosphate adenylyltransferase [Alphaproteobacteria bacterium CG11_big_fil_rev_8_21_14_0_20_44_7]